MWYTCVDPLAVEVLIGCTSGFQPERAGSNPVYRTMGTRINWDMLYIMQSAQGNFCLKLMAVGQRCQLDIGHEGDCMWGGGKMQLQIPRTFQFITLD